MEIRSLSVVDITIDLSLVGLSSFSLISLISDSVLSFSSLSIKSLPKVVTWIPETLGSSEKSKNSSVVWCWIGSDNLSEGFLGIVVVSTTFGVDCFKDDGWIGVGFEVDVGTFFGYGGVVNEVFCTGFDSGCTITFWLSFSFVGGVGCFLGVSGTIIDGFGAYCWIFGCWIWSFRILRWGSGLTLGASWAEGLGFWIGLAIIGTVGAAYFEDGCGMVAGF